MISDVRCHSPLPARTQLLADDEPVDGENWDAAPKSRCRSLCRGSRRSESESCGTSSDESSDNELDCGETPDFGEELYSQLKHEQLTDDYACSMIGEMSQETDQAKKEGQHFRVIEGTLYRHRKPRDDYPREETTKIVVPRAMVQQILKLCHDARWVNHRGRSKTFQEASRHFWWPGMRREAHQHVDRCIECKKRKGFDPKVRAPLQRSDIVSAPSMKIIHDVVRDYLLKAETRQGKYQHARPVTRKFEIGKKVLLYLPELKPGLKRKLAKPGQRLFEITEIKPPNRCKLKPAIGKRHQNWIHTGRLEKLGSVPPEEEKLRTAAGRQGTEAPDMDGTNEADTGAAKTQEYSPSRSGRRARKDQGRIRADRDEEEENGSKLAEDSELQELQIIQAQTEEEETSTEEAGENDSQATEIDYETDEEFCIAPGTETKPREHAMRERTTPRVQTLRAPRQQTHNHPYNLMDKLREQRNTMQVPSQRPPVQTQENITAMEVVAMLVWAMGVVVMLVWANAGV